MPTKKKTPKPKPKAFTFKLIDPIYHVDIFLVIGEEKLANIALKKEFDIEDTLKTDGCSGLHLVLRNFDEGNKTIGGSSIIWMEQFKKDCPCCLATLAHECFHKVADTLEHIGIKLEHEKNGEAYAYYQDFVFRGLLDALWNRK